MKMEPVIEQPEVSVEQRLEALEKAMAFVLTRVKHLESTIQKTLETAMRSEQLNELTVATTLQKTFATMSESLLVGVSKMQSEISTTLQDYVINILSPDSDEITENTLRVTKTEHGFAYEKISNPGEIITDGMRPFDKYFEDNIEKFEGKENLLVNIFVRKKEEQ